MMGSRPRSSSAFAPSGIHLAFLLAVISGCSLHAGSPPAFGLDANRLTYLDQSDPFYPNRNFPKLITPQWIGETGVQAVVILAIDDMNQPERWEKFLRPILDRLKQIDGRAPVSIMTVSTDPQHPQLQAWLKEGLSLEVHTLSHPCPCLARGDFAAASNTYHGSVELLNRIPGNKPVAFRMPCCDSTNSPSPRFYSELFNGTNSSGQFLTIDSSVMNIITANDPTLPPELAAEADGRERFRKYLPSPSFATTIEDYPYPYVIGRLCWEFPGVTPSDWQAQHFHGPNNPATLADWKAALDVTVRKQGVFNLIFHPHGWIRSEQVVELIDYAVQKYGGKVKFLTFGEAQERLDKNLLLGHQLRAANGQDNGVRLLDVNNDGYLDVVIADAQSEQTRIWSPSEGRWLSTTFPVALTAPDQAGNRRDTGVRFGIIHSGQVSALVRNESLSMAWTFDGTTWVEDKALLAGLELDGRPILTATGSATEGTRDRGVRFRDVDGDGHCEFLVGNESQSAVFSWSEREKTWKRLPYSLPPGTSIVDGQGRDNGLRFVDVNGDGLPDVLFSNEKSFSLHLFIRKPYLGFDRGWSREVLSGKRGDPGEIPMVSRNGTDNGAWFHNRELWVQNEDTTSQPASVIRRSFDSLLAGLQPPPLSPEDSLKAIRVRPGFKVELVAHEPLVQDPIAFEWGADGKLWVVEMGDYPLGVDGKGKAGGIVRFLEDTNHDGIYDKSTVFLEGLKFPTGVMPWGKGVIVSAAPEIFYAEDTDGDGKADVRKRLFTGFGEGNQQHRLNGFDYGLDNWIYGANGDSGGRIHAVMSFSSSDGESGGVKGEGVDISGRDFRFRSTGGSFEAQAGETQFGRHRDDWGNWFGNNNSIWLWHYFLPEQYISRNPHLPIETNKRMLANYPDASRVFPVSAQMQRFNDIGASGHVTSANSATPYRDDLFGADFATSVFISEPVYNLIHREVLEPDGVSFSSRRASGEKDSEFLASADNWFRPTMLKTGPDGALYIADMYRLVIEHPEWIPDDVKHHLDLRAGHDKGRIYRVYPAGVQLRPIPRLDQLATRDLAAALDSPNGWQRDTAQRLLVERHDPSAIKPLQTLAAKSARPKTRLQALCTLDGLGALRPELLKNALNDAHPAVREHAIRLSEPKLRAAKANDLTGSLLQLVSDPSTRVRYQLAFTLGEWHDPRAAQALVKIAQLDAGNKEIRAAVMSSAPLHLSAMLATVLHSAKDPEQSTPLLDSLLGLAAALGDQRSLAQALAFIATPEGGSFAPWQFSALASVSDGLDRRGQSLTQLQTGADPGLREAIQNLNPLFVSARQIAGSESAPGNPDPRLVPAVHLLSRGPNGEEQDLLLLAKLLQPQFSLAVQRASLQTLRHAHGEKVTEVLLSAWKSSSPTLRSEILDTLLTRREWVQALLTALEQEQIPVNQIGTVEQDKLRKQSDPALQERARKIFFSSANADRRKVVEAFRSVASLQGEPNHGKILFDQNCAMCHAFVARPQVGPDLGALADKSVETLLVAILDPNRAVEARYVNYTAVTKDDREFSGVLAAETANSITLRNPNGEETILRADLAKLTSSGLSLMPEGFERIFSPQDLADLISFLTKK